eukprot:6728198-Karenia_brevis.AAC.1
MTTNPCGVPNAGSSLSSRLDPGAFPVQVSACGDILSHGLDAALKKGIGISTWNGSAILSNE